MSIASRSSPSAGKGASVSTTIDLSPWSPAAQPNQFAFIALVPTLIATSFRATHTWRLLVAAKVILGLESVATIC